MTPRPWDVVVAGGGPAGLAAAIALGRQGVRVLVIERSTWPRDKVCGEGLMPVGVESLKRLDVFQRIDPSHLRPFQGIRWISEDGTTAETDFASGPGFGIRRTALSRALFEAASSLPSVQLWPSTLLMKMEQRDDCVVLGLRRYGANESVRARLVIGADGRNSKVRRLAELDGTPAVAMQRWGARQHFDVRPWTQHVEVWWSNGMEAYVTPSGPRQVEVAFLWDKSKFTPTRKGRELVTGLLDEFPQLRAKLGRQLPAALSKAAGIGPLALGASSPVADRVVLIGDALGYVDGITGEGISVALSQVEALERTLPPLLRSDNLSATDLKASGSAVQVLFKETVPLIKAALTLSRFPALRRLAIRGLRNASELFTHLLEANMGRQPLYRLPWRGVLQFLWGALRPSRSPRSLLPGPTSPERALPTLQGMVDAK
ncbi:MAG: monooxygenase [Rickettsiales bacterium]|nr:monooxygenase [Rickettsiales bacterium]